MEQLPLHLVVNDPTDGISERSLEDILIAVAKAKSKKGFAIHLPLATVFTEWFLKKLPNAIY